MVERELALLRSAGIEPALLERRSDDLLRAGAWAKLRAAAGLHAGAGAVERLAQEVATHRADLLHLHNPWPLLTYGVCAAAHRGGLPVVQTLHNWRLIASGRRLFGPGGARSPRDQIERDRLARMPPLYGGAAMDWLYTRAIARYWRERTIPDAIDAFICISRFQRDMMVAAGLPPERLVVKPNFLDHRGPVGDGTGGYALFVGRLGAEKGVLELGRAWARTGLPLKIVGDGPLAEQVRALPGVEALGRQAPQQVLALMAGARFLAVPARWDEAFGLVVIEALASGTPCLVADRGALPELVRDGVTGRVFRAVDEGDLVAQAKRLWEEAPGMRPACRRAYEARYTPAANLAMLTRIYANVLARRRPGEGVEQEHELAAAG